MLGQVITCKVRLCQYMSEYLTLCLIRSGETSLGDVR